MGEGGGEGVLMGGVLAGRGLTLRGRIQCILYRRRRSPRGRGRGVDGAVASFQLVLESCRVFSTCVSSAR